MTTLPKGLHRGTPRGSAAAQCNSPSANKASDRRFQPILSQRDPVFGAGSVSTGGRGTQFRNTAESGPVMLGKIENKGRQNRRINIVFAQ